MKPEGQASTQGHISSGYDKSPCPGYAQAQLYLQPISNNAPSPKRSVTKSLAVTRKSPLSHPLKLFDLHTTHYAETPPSLNWSGLTQKIITH